MDRAKCAVCGTAPSGEHLLRRCRYCGRIHCPAHLLPEKHGCGGLPGDGLISSGNRADRVDDGAAVGGTPAATGAAATGPPTGNPAEGEGSMGARQEPPESTPAGAGRSLLTAVPLALLGLPLRVLRHYRVMVVALLVIGASIAYGPVSAADVVGDPGRPVDETLTDAGDRLVAVAANVSAELADTFDDSTGGDLDPDTTPQPTADASPAGADSGASPSGSTEFERDVERAVHQKVNEERQSRDLEPVQFDPALAEIARYHSRDMAERDYFAHTAPDGESLGDRYEAHGYTCRVSAGGGTFLTGGENIFRMSYRGISATPEEIAEQVVSGWLASPSHRENLLKPAWRNEGIGVAEVRDDGQVHLYVTQNFC